MTRFLVLSLALALGTLHTQAVAIKMGTEALPKLPLKFTVTNGQLIDVQVLKGSPLNDGVLLHVTVERKDGSEKETFSLLVPPLGTQKIGLIQGWTPKHGDNFHLEADGFQTVDFGI